MSSSINTLPLASWALTDSFKEGHRSVFYDVKLPQSEQFILEKHIKSKNKKA